jgi:hypothetical protein
VAASTAWVSRKPATITVNKAWKAMAASRASAMRLSEDNHQMGRERNTGHSAGALLAVRSIRPLSDEVA